MERIRVYGKELERWCHLDQNDKERLVQIEFEYKEYDEDGELVGIGSEDFSADRWHKDMITFWLWTWDGERRNKGGHRWFECRGYVKCRRSDKKAYKKLAQKKYGAALVELR